jgi:hypothetical protein
MIKKGSFLFFKFFMNKKPVKNYLIVILIFLIGFVFVSSYNTMILKKKHYNLDETLWEIRGYNFIDELKNHNYGNLAQSTHPGITVNWLSGLFLNSFASGEKQAVNNYYDSLKLFYNPATRNLEAVITDRDAARYDFSYVTFIFNFPIYLLILLFFLVLHSLLLKSGFNVYQARMSVLLIATTPFYYFDTTPSDKFAAIFMTLSLLSLLAYFHRQRKEKKLLYGSGVGMGLAVLSRLSALFLIPFSFFIFIYFIVFKNKERIKNLVKDFSLWIFFSIITAFLLFPTLWLDFKSAYNKIKVDEIATERLTGEGSSDYYLKFILYIKDFLLGEITPLVFGLFLFFIIFIKFNLNKKETKDNIIILLSYVFLFFLFIVFSSNQYHFRYLLPAFLVIDILAAVGLCNIIVYIKKKFDFSQSIYVKSFFLVVLIQSLQFSFVYLVVKYNWLYHLLFDK